MKFSAILILSFFTLTTTNAQNAPDCGIRGPNFSSKSTSSSSSPSSGGRRLGIVGGVEATPHEFPWIASLGNSDYPGGPYHHHCVGVLITPQWILSTGECQAITAFPNPTVLVFVHRLSQGNWYNGTLDIAIKQYIPHPKFHFRLHDHALFNDVALVQLEKPVTEYHGHGTYRPACLPKQDDTYNGNLGNLTTVAGWGTTVDGNHHSLSDVLRKLEGFPIVSTDWCKEKWAIDNQEEANSIICTYAPGRDTCKSDSGAPLMVEEKGRLTVVGLASFGKGCAREGWPGANAHVSLFVDWIWETVHKKY